MGGAGKQRPARKQPSRLGFLLAAFVSVFAVYWAWRIVRMAQLADGELEAFLHDREEPASVEPTSASSGFLILETNFRVYAYTSSALWARVLALFVRIEYILPDLIVGSITRETVQVRTHRSHRFL